MKRILQFALRLDHTAVERVRADADGIVVEVRPWARYARRCPVCGRKCDVYDTRAPSRWRAMDVAASKCYLEYASRRVSCPEHGVHAEMLPWARPRSRMTRDFEEWVAFLAVRCSVADVARAARVEWHTVGRVCARVLADLEAARGAGRFEGLRRIGIDETSYKKGHKYVTVVVDHDSGRLVWAHEGLGRDVLNAFLDALTREQRRAVEVVTADGARWIRSLVRRRCPNARWVMDPFHVVSWMNDALDDVRCSEWRVAKARAAKLAPRRSRPGRPSKGDETPPEAAEAKRAAEEIKGTRWALVKDPGSLTEGQRGKLEALKRRAGSRLFRAWELKEDLRAVFRAPGPDEARRLLEKWLHDAAYCRIEQVVAVEKKVRRRKEDVLAAVELGASNARVEAINNKIKVTVRMSYGFRNVDNMIGLLMLRCSDVKPQRPEAVWRGRP